MTAGGGPKAGCFGPPPSPRVDRDNHCKGPPMTAGEHSPPSSPTASLRGFSARGTEELRAPSPPLPCGAGEPAPQTQPSGTAALVDDDFASLLGPPPGVVAARRTAVLILGDNAFAAQLRTILSGPDCPAGLELMPPPTDDTALENLAHPLSTATHTALTQTGSSTVGELEAVARRRWSGLRGLAPARRKELARVLSRHLRQHSTRPEPTEHAMTRLVPLAAPVGQAHPAAVVLCCLLLVGVALAGWWLERTRRPVRPPRGRLTVDELKARLAHQDPAADTRDTVTMPRQGNHDTGNGLPDYRDDTRPALHAPKPRRYVLAPTETPVPAGRPLRSGPMAIGHAPGRPGAAADGGRRSEGEERRWPQRDPDSPRPGTRSAADGDKTEPKPR